MASLSASYDAASNRVVLTGSGFDYPNTVTVDYISPSGAVHRYAIGEWAGGTLDTNYFNPDEDGEWTVNVYQADGKKHSKLDLVASATVAVTAAA